MRCDNRPFGPKIQGVSPLVIVIVALTICSGIGSIHFGSSVIAEENQVPSVDDKPDEPVVRYGRDVRPILTDYCFACHGTDEHSRAADLRLDQMESAVEMSAIVPGNASESELIARILSDDPDQVMPPPESKKSLTAEQRKTLTRWINQGAQYEDHWSFIAPKLQTPKSNAFPNWRKNPIDDYVAAGLADAGLRPAPEADPNTLFRRLHLDITGLPPSPEDRAEFVDDYARDGDVAYQQWIDRLMDRREWGEHRARYWLDAARYGDTHGLHFDNYREMWPYRDWVIKAFNSNQPFDQFIVEQIAGDLLDNPTESQLIATGFQRCNITTNEGGTIDEENLALYAIDRVQTFGWVFMGLTTNCAQCHDHKFDPFSMKDYYSLAAFFRNTTQGAKDGNRKDGRGPILVLPSAQDRPRWDAIPTELVAAKAAVTQHRKEAKPKIDGWLQDLTSHKINALVPAERLIAHLPLDETQGDSLRSFGELNATLHFQQPLIWKTLADKPPRLTVADGNAIDLGPIGDVSAQDAFSFSAYLNVPKDGGGGLIAKMDSAADYRGWDLYRQGNKLAVHLIEKWPDNALKAGSQADVLKPGKWQHISVTYDGTAKISGIKIFVDGKEVKLRTEKNTLKSDATFLTDAPLRFGSRSGGPVVNGLSVADFRIYRRALSKSEIETLAKIDSIRQLVASTPDPKSIQGKQRQLVEDVYFSAVDQEFQGLAQRVHSLEKEKAAIDARSPITHIQEERKESPAMAHILMRGQYDQKGDQVAADTPGFLHPMKSDWPKNRLGLARWLVDSANPLTARVTVNRFWQQIFGQGLVTTAEDFGVSGNLPSHPELLDFLALDFQDRQWDVKQFFKQIFTSATYRQAAITTPNKQLKDRDNRLLSRGPRFRMDAEMLRDTVLSASGLLSKAMYGPGVKPYQPSDIWNIVGLPGSDTRNYVQDKGESLYRRTLYTFWKRMAPPPSMEALNAPSREVCVVKRERTNTPLQALVTLNDPQFVEAARMLAQYALNHAGGDQNNALQIILDRVLCRPASDAEQKILLKSLAEFRSYYESNPEDASKLISVGESEVDDKLPAVSLAAWTLVCNQVMNLDEVVCK